MGFKIENITAKQISEEKQNDSIPFLQREVSFFGNAFSNKVKEDFYTELSVLLKAGVNLKSALELIGNSQKKKQNKALLHNISVSIVSGLALAEAIKKEKPFTDYEYYSLKIGEETGTLEKVSEQLGSFFSRKNEQKRQVSGALTYPIIILTTAILAMAFMLRFVVPMFQDIFKQQNVELPAITKLIISASKFIEDYGWLFVFGLLLIIALGKFFKKKLWYRKFKDHLVLKLPYVGNFFKTVYLSQFTQAVSLLTASKVPVVNSIQLVKKMINFYPLQIALENVEQNILRGKSLSESLKPHKLFDDKMIALVKVAEETNQNEFIFERLNMLYNSQVQQRSKLLSTVLEPIIITVVGIIVGVILIAMYLPMFKLSTILG